MIFNIPRQNDFIDSLIYWLEVNFGSDIFKLKIFFPNHRCCQKFHDFMRNIGYHGLSPDIKAIADLKIDDFYEFLPQFEVQNFIIEATKIKVLDDIEGIFFLTSELTKIEIFKNLTFERAFKIAIDLKELLDDIENNDLELANLEKIDDSNFALHRQISLDFLKDFYLKIKHLLLENGLMLKSSYQNFLNKNYCKFINDFGLKKITIIAGSTGSMILSRRIMKAVLDKNVGHVVLQGFEKPRNFYLEDSEKIESQSHPQFLFHQLIDFLGAKFNEVEEIKPERFLEHPIKDFKSNEEVKQKLISLLFIPAIKANLWQKAHEILFKNNNSKQIDQIRNNLKIIIAKNEIEEANQICQEIKKLEKQGLDSEFDQSQNQKPNLKIAVICNDDFLKNLIRSKLKHQKIFFNDSSSQKFFGSNLANFLLLIFKNAHEEFNPHNLLALIKNQYFLAEDNQKIISDFEIKILRQEIESNSFFDLLQEISQEKLQIFLQNIISILPRDKKLSSLLNSLKNFSNLEFNEILNDLIQKGEAGVEISEFFEKLIACEYNIESSAELGFIFSQITFFEKIQNKRTSSISLEILSPIEARLLKFDVIFVCGLLENNFPQIPDEGWIGNAFKKSLGIEKATIKIGQNALDFCNFLSCKKVFLSYGTFSKISASKPSPFLIKLKTLCHKAGIELEEQPIAIRKNDYFNKNDFYEKRLKAPNAKPKLQDRPDSYSITEISELISNPYAIYVKKVLKIKEQKKINYEPSNAEYGSFVHKALEEFVKTIEQNSTFVLDSDPKFFEKIFEKFFVSQHSKMLWLPRFYRIFRDFEIHNRQFFDKENRLEFPIATNFEIKSTNKDIPKLIEDLNFLINKSFVDEPEFTSSESTQLEAEFNDKLNLNRHREEKTRKISLSGRVDRIILDSDKNFAIYDYKTGNVPSKNEVINGHQPQLTISAYILLQGTLSKYRLTSLNYWVLSRSKGCEIVNLLKENDDLNIATNEVYRGLMQLFGYFENENNGFFACRNLKKDYIQNLSRIKEWKE